MRTIRLGTSVVDLVVEDGDGGDGGPGRWPRDAQELLSRLEVEEHQVVDPVHPVRRVDVSAVTHDRRPGTDDISCCQGRSISPSSSTRRATNDREPMESNEEALEQRAAVAEAFRKAGGPSAPPQLARPQPTPDHARTRASGMRRCSALGARIDENPTSN
ncbi:MAG: hypothetical protein AAF602_04630 [Myxococcota bacterium]